MHPRTHPAAATFVPTHTQNMQAQVVRHVPPLGVFSTTVGHHTSHSAHLLAVESEAESSGRVWQVPHNIGLANRGLIDWQVVQGVC